MRFSLLGDSNVWYINNFILFCHCSEFICARCNDFVENCRSPQKKALLQVHTSEVAGNADIRKLSYIEDDKQLLAGITVRAATLDRLILFAVDCFCKQLSCLLALVLLLLHVLFPLKSQRISFNLHRCFMFLLLPVLTNKGNKSCHFLFAWQLLMDKYCRIGQNIWECSSWCTFGSQRLKMSLKSSTKCIFSFAMSSNSQF